jgi:regulator of sirC expression with transglutaminase-like and TPR domain
MELDETLGLLARDPAANCDVAEVALRLAGDEYPGLDVEAYLAELDGMAHEARRYVRGDFHARVYGLIRYLFHDLGFHGNAKRYYDARNSYLNDVLDNRTGIPISLSVVAMAVGNRAGLNVVGVGLPGHFVAKAVADAGSIVFDPFHGGRQLTLAECGLLVQQVTGQPYEATTADIQATPAAAIVRRMLMNLKAVYLRDEDFDRAARVICRLRQLDPEDPLQRRDLGVSLLRAGQPGPAVTELLAYLKAAPHADDKDIVRRLVADARRDLARWN